MEQPVHPFSQLFDQLGLASDEASIRGFIAAHAPLDEHLRLEEAPFWSTAQAQLLREERIEDADWAIVVDQLNLALRERQPA